MSIKSIEKLELLLSEINENTQGHIVTSVFMKYRQIIEQEYENYGQLWGCMSEFSNIQYELDNDKVRKAKDHLTQDIKAAISILKTP